MSWLYRAAFDFDLYAFLFALEVFYAGLVEVRVQLLYTGLYPVQFTLEKLLPVLDRHLYFSNCS